MLIYTTIHFNSYRLNPYAALLLSTELSVPISALLSCLGSGKMTTPVESESPILLVTLARNMIKVLTNNTLLSSVRGTANIVPEVGEYFVEQLIPNFKQFREPAT